MRVVQKDKRVAGVLGDELERCQQMVDSLNAAIAKLPRGSIHERRVCRGQKCYVYPFLKYREGGKSIFQHLSREAAEDLRRLISERQSKEKQVRDFSKRIQYLKKLLRVGG